MSGKHVTVPCGLLVKIVFFDNSFMIAVLFDNELVLAPLGLVLFFTEVIFFECSLALKKADLVLLPGSASVD